MPQPCTICIHPQRPEIDAALVAGDPNRRIAARIGATEQALRRHKAQHVPVHLAKAQEAKTVADADSLLRDVGALRGKAISLLLAAERSGDLRTALAGVREARGCIELLAKLLGELQDGPVVNITISPAWLSVRAQVVGALAPYPEARVAVAGALAALEGGPDADD